MLLFLLHRLLDKPPWEEKNKLTSDLYKTQGWITSCLPKDVSAGFNFTLKSHWCCRGLRKYCFVNVCALLRLPYM